jgi:sulfide:quinone oxidoreductase
VEVSSSPHAVRGLQRLAGSAGAHSVSDMSELSKLNVLVVGGGVAAMETVLALRALADDRVALSVLAPGAELVYRPMSVREPFSFSTAARYPLAPMLAAAGAELVAGELASVDDERRRARTASGEEIPYDVLVLALGARPYARYEHAITIDDRRMDEVLHGLIQDVEGGYVDSLAFVAPPRMAWPLPLYELALMTAGRAADQGAELQTTILTSEDRPLGVFGEAPSSGVAALLAARKIRMIPSAYVEIPRTGELVVNPGDRRLRAKRVVALPELYGPAVKGLPVSEHGFLRVDVFGRVTGAHDVYAAGDAVDFPVKQGGIACQQADVVAESIAAMAGAPVEPRPFSPVLHGVLLTDGRPRYLKARITGGQGYASEFSEEPIDGVTQKIDARYLAPYLESLDENVAA